VSLFTLEIFKGGVGAEGHINIMLPTLKSGTGYLRWANSLSLTQTRTTCFAKRMLLRGELAGEVTVRSFGKKCDHFHF